MRLTDDSQHFERSDGQESCVNESVIRGVEETTIKKSADAKNAGVGELIKKSMNCSNINITLETF